MNNTKKIIFFDIDGTLSDFSGNIPKSTIDAIKKVRENGHLAFICTGRSLAQIEKKIINIGFDGIVAAAGAYIEFKGKEIYHSVFGEEKIKFLAEFMMKNNISFIIQTKNGCYLSKKSGNDFKKVFARRLKNDLGIEVHNLDDFSTIEEIVGKIKIDNEVDKYHLKYPDTESMIYCDSCFSVEETRNYFMGKNLKVTPSSFKKPDNYSGEITKETDNKASGIEKVIEYLGMSIDDTIAFGDGPNDIEMIEYVKYGIAMGNAVDDTKNVSNYITDDVENEGIYKALKKFELI
ncbi:Cof-type HAD-IIB family hydrolase [Lachnobacterium bovis]|uniref:Cof-type HAD-IIB family hydrolase n=1 Tax=Lachnobacterium bovis TaxID=140626 RepID=UPI0003B57327|nr:Cof-type HAD-IIB family hydrolase [Lachnobacterium bovis]